MSPGGTCRGGARVPAWGMTAAGPVVGRVLAGGIEAGIFGNSPGRADRQPQIDRGRQRRLEVPPLPAPRRSPARRRSSQVSPRLLGPSRGCRSFSPPVVPGPKIARRSRLKRPELTACRHGCRFRVELRVCESQFKIRIVRPPGARIPLRSRASQKRSFWRRQC